MIRLATALALLFSTGSALAECPAPEVMKKAAEGWLAGERLPDPGLASGNDAACAYTAYREALTGAMGAPVGVKVGFTSKPAQEAFGVSGPVAGALFAPMILDDGTELSLADARTPFFEADLIVTVGDPAIMQAMTREEAAAALAEIRPFIELPDLALAEGVKPDGLLMTAYGVMPWRGVMGKGISIADLDDPVADLASLTVDLTKDRNSVGTASGDMLLGHPLDVVLWLVREGGYDLEPGSMISLGSLGKLHPAEPGHEIRADYMIGGKSMSVSAKLTE